MSDFDTVLERLLSDPSFARALATDRASALAGYQLSADEIELLSSQISEDAGGGQSAVEERTNKSSAFGLLAPLAGLGGMGGHGAFGGLGHHGGLGDHSGLGHQGGLGGHGGLGGRGGLGGHGDVPGQGGFGAAGGAAAGTADGITGQGGFGAAGGITGQGAGSAAGGGAGGDGMGGIAGALNRPGGVADALNRPGGVADGFNHPSGGLGDALDHGLDDGHSGFGAADAPTPGSEPVASPPPPAGYHTRVDVDGDGHWDKYSLRGRGDGGVDILVDRNHDGRVDFVGHDDNADGLVESADYDKNRDGVFETHMYDDNGDGWMDRTVVDRHPPQGAGPAGRHSPGAGPVGRNLRVPEEEGFGGAGS